MKKTCLLVFFVLLIIPAFTLDAVVVSVLGKAEMQTSKGWQPMKEGVKIDCGNAGFDRIQIAGGAFNR